MVLEQGPYGFRWPLAIVFKPDEPCMRVDVRMLMSDGAVFARIEFVNKYGHVMKRTSWATFKRAPIRRYRIRRLEEAIERAKIAVADLENCGWQVRLPVGGVR